MKKKFQSNLKRYQEQANKQLDKLLDNCEKYPVGNINEFTSKYLAQIASLNRKALFSNIESIGIENVLPTNVVESKLIEQIKKLKYKKL